MIVAIVLLSLLLLVSLAANVVLAIVVLRYARILFKVEENVNRSLDVLDNSYRTISRIAEMPVLFDSPEIRSVMDNLRRSRDVVLFVAGRLTNFDEEEEKQNDEEDDEDEGTDEEEE